MRAVAVVCVSLLYIGSTLSHAPPPPQPKNNHAQPHAITAKRMGVGACLWEGELLLAAYLGVCCVLCAVCELALQQRLCIAARQWQA
jgi:hypothetical protein